MALITENLTGSAVLKLKRRVPGIDDRVVLLYPETTIGRHPNSRLCIPRKMVSRFHARILRKENEYLLEDTGSSNGTYVNGNRVLHHVLKPGDRIGFGDVEFIFEQEDDASARPQNVPDSNNIKLTASPSEVSDEVLHVQQVGDAEGVLLKLDQVTSASIASKYLRAHYELLGVIRQHVNPESLMDSFLELMLATIDVDCGVILYPDEAGIMEPVAMRLRSSSTGERAVIVSQTIVEKCIAEQVAVLARDASHDTRFSSSDSVVAQHVRSAICVPLLSRGSVSGVCYLDLRRDAVGFTDSDLAFVSNLCLQLVLALDNLRLTRERMEAAQMELIGRTMSEISHSLKNILSITHSGVEVLERHLLMGRVDAALKTWGMVRHGMERMHSLAKAMLDYSRNETYKRSEVQINDVLAEVEGSLRVNFENFNLKLEIRPAEHLQTCWLDPVGLYDVLMNLAMNARDALETKEPGTASLTIATELVGNRVLLSIKDNGPGIPMELQERIFNPFFTTKGAHGNGMGLAMVQKFTRDMGGMVELVSDPGKGACFNLYFPIASMDEEPEHKGGQEEDSGERWNGNAI